MRNIRLFGSVFAGTCALAAAWGAVVAGCDSSGTQVTTGDAAADQTTDAPKGDSAPEAGGGDSSEDGQGDASPDGPTEATSDGSDGGTGMVGDSQAPMFDGSALDFEEKVAEALCNNIAACCGTSGDAATFGWQACVASQLAGGFHGSSTGAVLASGGNVVFNTAKAAACLNELASVDCVANQVTGPEQTQIFQDCFAAYTGTLPVGSACHQPIECAPGNFCNPVDGGVGDAGAIGLCQPLVGVGGACGFLGANVNVAQSACSYRGSGSNGFFCRNYDPANSATQIDPSLWTCQPQQATGTGCYADQDCTSFICLRLSATQIQCQAAGNWFNPAFCSAFITDAGGGG
jgi:hypothetical protein